MYEWPASHTRVFDRGPAPADPAARRDYARVILSKLASRAFRRPVEPGTLDRLADLALAGPTFDASLAMEFMGFSGPELKEGMTELVEKRRAKFDPTEPF